MKWLGEGNCNICGQDFENSEYEYFYDCKTSYGPWGVLCQNCYDNVGLQVGQIYRTNDFVKVGNLHNS